MQLANFEFFSGVFKDITISLGQTDGMALSWEIMGVYEAKNVRGVQVRINCLISESLNS